MTSSEKDVLLIIIDISGYTKFMISNKNSLVHGQIIITELINEIIKQIQLPFVIAKLEGDAVFLYCEKGSHLIKWNNVIDDLENKLLLFFKVFSLKIAELSGSNICNCSACQHIQDLKLKIVIHSGKAVIYSINNGVELSGIDVIIVHRLLKNSVNSDEYIIFSEDAYQALGIFIDDLVSKGRENYNDLGSINTYVYDFNKSNDILNTVKNKKYSSFFKLKKLFKRITLAFLFKLKLTKYSRFNNFED